MVLSTNFKNYNVNTIKDLMNLCKKLAVDSFGYTSYIVDFFDQLSENEKKDLFNTLQYNLGEYPVEFNRFVYTFMDQPWNLLGFESEEDFINR